MKSIKSIGPYKKQYLPDKENTNKFNFNNPEQLLFEAKPKMRNLSIRFNREVDYNREISTEGKDINFLPKINHFIGRNVNSPKFNGNRNEINYQEIVANNFSFPLNNKNCMLNFLDSNKFSIANKLRNKSDRQILNKINLNNDISNSNISKEYLTFHHNISTQKIFNKIKIPKIKQTDIVSDYISPREKKKIIKEFSIMEEINYAYKDQMEDYYKFYEKSDLMILFCLFDGHGGDYVAKFANERYPEIFFNYLSKFDNNAYKTFNESLSTIDSQLDSTKAQFTGATSTIVYITYENGRKYLYSANLGDSRSLLLSKEKFLRLSYDHKCSDKLEVERMKSHGGFIINGRLLGTLNLSRGLGDLALKKSGLSNIPYINKIELSKDDLFVIIASDGVWDVISDLDAYNLSKHCSNSKQLSENLVKQSISLGSRDNISCIAIYL